MEQTGAAIGKMDQEFEDRDSGGRWQKLFLEIRNQSHECSYKVAKYPENRNRNRYRDVNPFDHSRVKLENTENDYINASLVVMEEAQRTYILTQGPLKNTCGHFWLMIWEQKTKAVVMLNRVIEKGSEKCAQYWPTAEEREMAFRDTGFLVALLSEDTKSYYTTRILELQNLNTGEKRQIYHFHYTTWPDFGVPESPASFLNFLFKVRESGALGVDHGPTVVHCSAGIGRSGTFSLVDTCLVLIDKRKDPSSVDIKSILLKMRKYRMGLIQTSDQLRFSYMAVFEGAKFIMGDSSVQVIHRHPALVPRITMKSCWICPFLKLSQYLLTLPSLFAAIFMLENTVERLDAFIEHRGKSEVFFMTMTYRWDLTYESRLNLSFCYSFYVQINIIHLYNARILAIPMMYAIQGMDRTITNKVNIFVNSLFVKLLPRCSKPPIVARM
uniref:protein-tyrosine-phosphatase n=1 Tax=Nothobranchius furzeri TaxID=105023 RepID=A0A1A8AX03_NOTFU